MLDDFSAVPTARFRLFAMISVAKITPSQKSPRETYPAREEMRKRACVLLKDVFDYSLEEIAELVDSTVGGVKAALHRGRSKIKKGLAGTNQVASRRESGIGATAGSLCRALQSPRLGWTPRIDQRRRLSQSC